MLKKATTAQKISFSCSLLVICIALVVLLGWVANIAIFKSVIPGHVDGNPLGALCFLMMGLGIALANIPKFSKKAKLFLYIVGGFAYFIGLLLFLRSVFNININPDHILFRSKLNGNSISPTEGFDIWLLGLACFTIAARKHLASTITLFWVLLSGGFVLVGYLYEIPSFYGVKGTLAPTSILGGLNIVLLGIALFSLDSYTKLLQKVTGTGSHKLRAPDISLLIIFLTILVTATAVNVYGYRSFKSTNNYSDQVKKYGAIILENNQLLSSLKDAETGQRGYLLTGNETYLAPFYSAQKSVPALLSTLIQQTSADPIESSRIKDASNLINLKLAELNQTVLLKKQNKTAAALAVVNTNVGNAYMEKLRSTLTSITTDYQRILDASGIQQTSRSKRASVTIFLGNLVSGLLLILTYILLIREMNRRYEFETNLHQFNNKLAEIKNKDEAILSGIGEGLVMFDAEGGVERINRAGLNMLGYTEEEVIGQPFTRIIKAVSDKGVELLPTDRPAFLAITRRETTTKIFYYQRKNGETFPVMLSVAPVILHGKLIGAIEIFRDITAEQQLEKAKDEFVSLASHQLRTPLTAIRLFSEMLSTGSAGKLKPKQADYLDKIEISTERMIRLVGDILNVSRIETGKLIVEPKPTDIVAFIKSYIDEVSPLADEKNVKLHFEKSETHLPLIQIDQTLYGQIIHNLLTNAIRYTNQEPGKGTVTVKFYKHADDYYLSVTDNGIGIPEKVAPRIFERFFRADNAMLVAGEGTGLGLYLIKMIVETAGGKIWFESKENVGTTFYVTIPTHGMRAKKGDKKIETRG